MPLPLDGNGAVLPTWSIASAMISPMVLSQLAETEDRLISFLIFDFQDLAR